MVLLFFKVSYFLFICIVFIHLLLFFRREGGTNQLLNQRKPVNTRLDLLWLRSMQFATDRFLLNNSLWITGPPSTKRPNPKTPFWNRNKHKNESTTNQWGRGKECRLLLCQGFSWHPLCSNSETVRWAHWDLKFDWCGLNIAINSRFITATSGGSTL